MGVLSRPRPDRQEATAAVDVASTALAALDVMLPKVVSATGRNFPRFVDARQRLASCVEVASHWEPQTPKPLCSLENCSNSRCMFAHRNTVPDPFPRASAAMVDSHEPAVNASSLAQPDAF